MTIDSARLTAAAGDVAPDAEKLFRAWHDMSVAEERLLDRLDSAGLEPLDWVDFWWDNYDTSFEFGPVADGFALPSACLSVLWGAGFSRGWVNFADATQIYYTPNGQSPRHASSLHSRGGKLASERRARKTAEAALAIGSRVAAAAGDIWDALYEAHRYFIERLDVVDGDSGPKPNREMQLAQKLSDAMDAAGLSHD